MILERNSETLITTYEVPVHMMRPPEPVRCRIDTANEFLLQGTVYNNYLIAPRSNRTVLRVMVNDRFLSHCVAQQVPSERP